MAKLTKMDSMNDHSHEKDKIIKLTRIYEPQCSYFQTNLSTTL